ncbi:MAG: AMP-binding protein [Proteobacteria bacterium]|nr:AMP-binding protein [Pseudomonadota bacterium]MBU1451468.1 AMP-binding protein [Pseudomonadota bacterium]MBU2470497.1 AMP-binding protein [Pseudomonadota bacterium]MBU2516405.1 AMP-binding protein [Pseudomonadota bacterium]
MHAAGQMLFSYMAEKNAKYHPDKTYLVEGGRSCGFGRFETRTNQLARGLMARGLQTGGRVCILNHNAIENLEVFFGAMKAGGVFCPINARLAAPEVMAIVKDARPSLVVAGPEYRDKITGCKEMKIPVALLSEDAEDLLAYETLLAGRDAGRVEPKCQEHDLAALIYTSGTTGRPKGVMWTHRNLFSSAQASAISRRTSPDDVAMVAAPVYQAAGVGTVLSSTYRGNTVVLLNKFDPEAYLAAIQAHRVTTAFVVPAMVLMLLRSPALDKYDISSLTTICYGSAPMPLNILREAMERFAWRFMGACGATETSPGYIAFLGDRDHRLDGSPEKEKRLSSIGKESINAQVRIFDERDQESPPGEVGEIVLRGSNVMAGYWGQPELTNQVLRAGFYHTGDMGYRDEDNYIFLVDRKSDLIISGGFNVYPKEIENALCLHPAVLQAAVVGRPHPTWGETPVAFVVFRMGEEAPEKEELMDMLRQNLAGYKLPRGGIHYLAELPLTAAGKIDKRRLRNYSDPLD